MAESFGSGAVAQSINRETGARLISAVESGQSVRLRMRPASESAKLVVRKTFEDPARTNCPLRRSSSTIRLMASERSLERCAPSMIRGALPSSSRIAAIWPYGSALIAVSVAASSRHMKRPLAKRSRTSDVLPAWRGPIRLTTLACVSAASNSGMRCLGR